MHVEIERLKLHYTMLGVGDPILFIHGFPLCGAMWLPAARLLPPGWQAVIPDLRGHGQSDASPTVTIQRFAEDLAELLDMLGEQRPAVVCGLSMGGIVAFEFFRRFRARTRALVLVDTRANPESPEGVRRRDAMAEAALTQGAAAVVDMMIAQVFARSAPATLRDEWRSIMNATPPMGVAAAARALGSRPDSNPTLGLIDCPTLVVCGDEDEITSPAMMREMHTAIPGSRFELIAGAGHVPPVEQAAAFAGVLGEFLQALPPLAR